MGAEIVDECGGCPYLKLDLLPAEEEIISIKKAVIRETLPPRRVRQVW
jgi:hypothetical protein